MTDKSQFLNTLIYIQAAILIIAILYFGSSLFVPMCYGLLLAIVLYPLCRWMESKGIPRTISIAVCLLLVTVLFTLLVSILIVQFDVFRKDLPDLLKKFDQAALNLQQWIKVHLGVSVSAQHKWWDSAVQSAGNNSGTILTNVIYATVGTFATLLLIPVYTALFLYNRTSFVMFLSRVVPDKQKTYLPQLLQKVVTTYAHFIKGTAIVYLIVGALNSIGLLLLNIPHAILFGMLTAIMTIIPYVGIVVSALLPISVAWLTKDSVAYPLGVVAIFTFVQYLEANIIFPKVVATQLNVSTWATLVAIIAGGLLWGISGMILFIPFVGILKIIFDQIPSWRVFNILLARQP